MLLLAAKRGVPIIATTALLNKGKREESLIIIMEEKMRKILLMSSALALLSGTAEAACIQTPSCSSLGYTSSSSCSGGVKCPFGNAWNCSINDIKTEFNNKITELETTIKKIQQGSNNENKVNCKVGDILYSDMSCNANVVASKTPIGVVFDATNRRAIGLIEKPLAWSENGVDIPEIMNLTEEGAIKASNGLNNTYNALYYCQSEGYSCPAIEYVTSYKTEGTKVGDWHLPALGELYTIYTNKGIINRALDRIGATEYETNYYWSSSEYSSNNAWGVGFSGGRVEDYGKNRTYSVRPVLAF